MRPFAYPQGDFSVVILRPSGPKNPCPEWPKAMKDLLREEIIQFLDREVTLVDFTTRTRGL